MNKDWFNLKEGWIVSKCIPVVPLGLDLTYPAALQNLCVLARVGHPDLGFNLLTLKAGASDATYEDKIRKPKLG